MRVIDLVHEFPKAEKRSAGAAFEVAEHTFSAVRHATIVAPAPSRIIWTVNFPARGLLRTAVAVLPDAGVAPRDASVTFRLGISDHRIYEPLVQQTLSASDTERTGWSSLTADLSRYGGWQWSLFYRPDSHPWRLIFNADAAGGRALALWGGAGIETDAGAARDWFRRAGAPASAERGESARLTTR